MIDSPTSVPLFSKVLVAKSHAVASREPPSHARRQKPRVPATQPASKRSLSALHRRAQVLINCAAGVWTQQEIAQLTAIRVKVRKALRTLPARHKKRATKFLYTLDRITRILQSNKAKGSHDRGDPARHEHPDRNRITDYNPAGGRIRWATPKR
jgi:hypothetical protein